MNTNLTNQLMRAVFSKFEAQREEALAVVELYLNTPVGVAQHSNIVGELEQAVSQLATAEESLETLRRNFLRAPDEEVNNDD